MEEENVVTMLDKLIDPEVMAPMISAKVEKKIRVLPYAKLDTTLQGRPGSTITVPKYQYIGDAVDVPEGESIPVRGLETSTEQYTIKKAGIGASITDEAALCGYGNPVGQANNQMALSIASKCDNDAVDELYKAKTSFVSSDIMNYRTMVNAIDIFDEEEDSEKVVFIHPKQATQLRLDPDFIDKSKYGNDVMVSGEIGMIANTRIVKSKKVKKDETEKYYLNPIVKLEEDTETEDEIPALTYYLKRDTNIEKERISKKRKTEITGDKHYVVALTNDEKVVICKSLVSKEVSTNTEFQNDSNKEENNEEGI